MAFSALVHGYAKKPELAKSVNMFYLQMIALCARVFFEYVPSKANIADLPSREAFTELRSELRGLSVRGSAPDRLVVASVGSWNSPLETWLSRGHRDKELEFGILMPRARSTGQENPPWLSLPPPPPNGGTWRVPLVPQTLRQKLGDSAIRRPVFT